MAVKKGSIADLVDKSMSGRGLSDAAAPPDNVSGRERFKPAPKQSVMIRLDEGDYRTLQRIAEARGTKASALIRQAVKEIIKAEGGI
jgi:16S rRNA U516 pseudouridylate synthase RsuA-like enzyme